MSNKTKFMPDDVHAYVMRNWVREPEILGRLREETLQLPNHEMQISAEQGQLMAVLTKLMGVRRYLEVGVFTGYSSLAVAMAMPEDGRVVACDISEEFTRMARRYWAEAGVADKIDLRIGPAVETLAALDEAPFDMAFIDADKQNYANYYEACLGLVRPGGMILVDNVIWSGKVADPSIDDPDTEAMRAFNRRLHEDERIDLALIPIADGLTVARVR